jgi:hypothetical protein
MRDLVCGCSRDGSRFCDDHRPYSHLHREASNLASGISLLVFIGTLAFWVAMATGH